MHEILEKQSCQTQIALKIIVACIRKGRQVAEEDCWQPVMLEEEARRQRCLHAPTCTGVWGIGQILMVAHVAHTCTFRPQDSVVWVVDTPSYLGGVSPRSLEVHVSKHQPPQPTTHSEMPYIFFFFVLAQI